MGVNMESFRPPEELALDVETLKKMVKLNFHPDADIEIKDGKIYIVVPLSVLFKYRVDGNVVYISTRYG